MGVALVATGATAVWLWVVPARTPAIVRTADQSVLLVTIDTLRADALGSYGGRASTANLDRLAAEGLRFDFAHAHAVVTLPSHASILTGLYPFAHGIRDNAGFRLSSDTPTLASRLKGAGLATGAFIGAFPLDRRFGLDAAFDVYDSRLPAARGPMDFVLPERRADEVVTVARNWIRRQQGRWFAWVHVFDPHAPYQPPPSFTLQRSGTPYEAEVSFTDAALGPLLQDARDGTRRTLVVVTADHGEALGDHGEATHGVFAYEATLRVPLIIAQLGRDVSRHASAIVDAPARHIDLVPTVLDALQLPPDASLPGSSLLGLDRAGAEERRDLYFEAMMPTLTRGWAPLAGVIAGREKLIDLPLPELYDLASDPRESTNLIDRRLDRRRVLEARLRGFGPVAPPLRQAEDREVIERLRALGYLGGTASQRERYTEADDPKRLIAIDQLLHRASELYESGRAIDAADVYRDVLQRRPDTESAWRYLAFVQWETGARHAAVGTLEEALRRGLVTDALRTQLVIYLAETGAAARALALADASSSQDPDALNALGIALARAGRTDAAARTFERLLQQDPSNALALQNIGSVQLQRGDAVAARRTFERALQVEPRLAGAWTGLGVAERELGRPEAAIQAWQRAVELDPGEYDALYNLGIELTRIGREAEARPWLERFAATAPPAAYRAELAHVRRLLGRAPI